MSIFAAMPLTELRALDREKARRAVVEIARKVSDPKVGDEELDRLREKLNAARDSLAPADEAAEATVAPASMSLCNDDMSGAQDFDAGASGGSLWVKKDIARIGEYKHPITGRPFSLTRDRALRMARETNRYMAATKQPIPVPNSHSTKDAEGNLGWGWSLEVEGDRLVAVMEASSPEAKQKIGKSMRAVSMRVAPELKSDKGEVFRDVIEHIAVTMEPALGDQKNFEVLTFSREAVGAPNEKQEATAMSFEITEEAAKAVNLSRTPSKEDVSAALIDLSRNLEAAKTERDGLSQELAAIKAEQAAAEAAEWSRFMTEMANIAAENKSAESWGRQKDAIQKIYDAGCADQAREFARVVVGAKKAPTETAPAHTPDAVQAAKDTADFSRLNDEGYGWICTPHDDGLGYDRVKGDKTEKRRFEVTVG